jgi:PAS domain S-box-containing protein
MPDTRPRAKGVLPAILIVDDHPANRIALEAVLTPLGHRIVCVSSGPEALEFVLENECALILLDVQMPVMDGFQTASLIRADPRTGRIPIIFVTAISRDLEHVLKGYSHGAVDYLLKPIDPEILRWKASAFVELYLRGERLRASEASLYETERERLEQRNARILAESEQRYRSLVLATASIVWRATASGDFAADSPSWIAFTGQRADEHRGFGWLNAVHPDDRDATRIGWLEAMINKGPYSAEYRLRRHDGTYAYLSAHAVPIFDLDGSVREWIGAATDITDRKAAEQERERIHALERRAHEVAERAVRVRDDFFSVASHELNTPLSPLKLQVAMLRRELEPAQVTMRADAIERQIDRLAALVSRLLDVTRIAAGPLVLEFEELDLGLLVRDVVGRFRPEAAADGCDLRLGTIERVVSSFDRVRMEQVLTNLLSNAVKYGQGHPVDVSLEVRQGAAHIHVRDQGIGIAPQFQSRIFERFERAAATANCRGFGLGLWIVRQIVDACDGRVIVESRLGEGSTFTIELPLRAAGGGTGE